MNKITLFVILISVILFSYMNYRHMREINDINKKFNAEIELTKKKYEAKINDIQMKYNRLDTLYKEREDINEKYSVLKEKIKEDTDRIESLIIEKPVLIESKINNSIQKLMEDIYEETNSFSYPN